MMHYEAVSPVIGHALTFAVLAIFALGMVFWLLLAFRIGRSILRKRTAMERSLLASHTSSAEATPQMSVRAS